ncbi:Hypothetical protein CINCED_3A010886 [Cinara cedri]|uniref:Uncharacterized protein n=1 Tax=Cinara cedri TaxID=506608 RepID=A0A5E4LYH8_9HEMI|nr:Hypothetical protein CINCED_3A010886 [Cinara cedri]
MSTEPKVKGFGMMYRRVVNRNATERMSIFGLIKKILLDLYIIAGTPYALNCKQFGIDVALIADRAVAVYISKNNDSGPPSAIDSFYSLQIPLVLVDFAPFNSALLTK